MVLDPFSALGLASNIAQFVDFSSKLISNSYELYKSTGHLVETIELKMVANDLSQLTDKLQRSSQNGLTPPGSPDEEDLKKLAASCKEIADELLAILRDLGVKSPHQKWQSFRQALRTARKKEKIDALERRINLFRQQITMKLVAILR